MSKNLYWVKVSLVKDAQDPRVGRKTEDHFISSTADDFEAKLNTLKSNFRRDSSPEIVTITRL